MPETGNNGGGHTRPPAERTEDMKEHEREMTDIIGMIPGSCSCGTMTPAPSFHDETCSYRDLATRLQELEAKEKQPEPSDR